MTIEKGPMSACFGIAPVRRSHGGRGGDFRARGPTSPNTHSPG